MKNFRPMLPKDSTRQYIRQDSSNQSTISLTHPPQPTPKHNADLCSIVQSNRFQNLMIKLTYRRLNWVFQNIKLVDFDVSSILEGQDGDKSRSEMMSMTAHNLVLVIDKVLLIKIQNKLSDGFLRMKLMKKRKNRRAVRVQENVKPEQKIAFILLSKLFQRRQLNSFSRILTNFPLNTKKSRFQSMQNIQQSISKYKSEITRLENVSYKSKNFNYNTPPSNIYIPKQSYRTPNRRSSGSLISDFQNCLTDVTNRNFKKNKNTNY